MQDMRQIQVTLENLSRLIEAYKLYEWDAVSNTTNSVLENEGVESQNSKADLAITGLNNATGSYDVVISNLSCATRFQRSLGSNLVRKERSR